MKIKLDQVKQSQGQHRLCSTDQKLTLNDVTQPGTDNTAELIVYKVFEQEKLVKILCPTLFMTLRM